jgi:hypothetical protein
LDSLETRFWSKVDIKGPEECWLWVASKNPQGYGTFNLNGRTRSAHVIAFLLAHPDLDQPEAVRHQCDTPLCCNPNHLLPGTKLENMRDAKERKRNTWGERQNRAKLTLTLVAEIRATYAAGGITKAQLARQYSLSRTHISKIILGRLWPYEEAAWTH